jgi:hypothetical protein
MLVATFGPSTGWAGRTITHDGGRFLLEGFGPVTARAVLDYDANGQLDWAYAGLPEWVLQVELAERAAMSSGSTPWTAQPPAQPQVGVAGFVLSLVGFIFPIAWIVGLVLCWLDVRRARRDDLPHGLALAGLIISAVGTALSVVGVLLFVVSFASFATMLPTILGQAEAGDDWTTKEGIHSIEVGVQSWAVDHKNIYPDASEVTESGLASYVDDWPTNPFTGLPMAQGTARGDFTYTAAPDGASFQLTGIGRDGLPIITVP